jgi:catechol 2,3-dioxygenase-like lactoylglutathione lyase family enzyme
VVARLSGAALAAGIIARDAPRMFEFYRGFLGLPLIETMEFPEQGATVWLFSTGAGRIKVSARTDVPAATNPPGVPGDATGVRYLTVEVVDVEEAIAGIEESDGSLQSPPKMWGDAKVAFVWDPDGNSIELVERAG